MGALKSVEANGFTDHWASRSVGQWGGLLPRIGANQSIEPTGALPSQVGESNG